MTLKWKLISIHLEIVLILTQIGAWFAPNVPWAQNKFWTRPMELLRDMCRVESCFDAFGDGVSVGARKMHGLGQTYHGSEIGLDTPDGTPT